MEKRLSKSEYEHLAAFRYALRRFFRFSERAARPMGLEPQQHQALLAIRGFPGREKITLGELAEQLQIRPHSAVGLVNRLIKLGMVQRQVHAQDKRQIHVLLTPHGQEVLETLSAVHREELRRLGPHLNTLLKRLSRPPEGESL